jgi:hypothetical protein
MIPESVENRCRNIYISGACNSNAHAADWGENDDICVAIGEAIAILKPASVNQTSIGYNAPAKNVVIYCIDCCFQAAKAPRKIEKTYLAHSSRVNVVKWNTNLEGKTENALISAAVNGNAIVWILNDQDDYVPKFVLKGIDLFLFEN